MKEECEEASRKQREEIAEQMQEHEQAMNALLDIAEKRKQERELELEEQRRRDERDQACRSM